MEKISRNLGPKFRKIRKEKGFTLEKASSGIISSPTLSRWETGKQDIRFAVCYKLLKRLGISIDALGISQNNTPKMIDKITLLYINNNTDDLAKLSKKLLANYSDNKNVDNLLVAATACNFYLDLSGIDLTDGTFKAKLILEISKIDDEYRSDTDIDLFTNSQLLLKPQKIYDFAQILISRAFTLSVVPQLYSRPILNAVWALIQKKSPQYARKLLKDINRLNLSPFDDLEYHRKKFLGLLLDYIDDLDESKVTNYLSNSNIPVDTLKSSIFSFNQVKEIYC